MKSWWATQWMVPSMLHNAQKVVAKKTPMVDEIQCASMKMFAAQTFRSLKKHEISTMSISFYAQLIRWLLKFQITHFFMKTIFFLLFQLNFSISSIINIYTCWHCCCQNKKSFTNFSSIIVSLYHIDAIFFLFTKQNWIFILLNKNY